MTKPWNLQKQKDRGARLFTAVRNAAREYFDLKGVCLLGSGAAENVDRKPDAPFYLREIIHSAAAFFEGSSEDIAFANKILAQVQLASCDFSTMSLIEIILRHGEAVSEENRSKMLPHIEQEITHVIKSYNSFMGYNDNFPSMACFIMIVGGELTNNPKAVQAGIDNLYSLRDLLTRRGFFSEYNSPTYAGVTLHGLGETASRAKNAEARRLAQEGAERMWLDIALHWHPEISYHSGPHSRAYHGNSMGWSGLSPMVMWLALGEAIVPNPFNTIFGSDASTCYESRSNTLAFCRAGCGGYAGTTYAIPDWIGELALSKSYPFRVKGTAECGTFHVGEYRRLANGAAVHIPGRCADFGASESNLTTYMTKEFSVGTASRAFLDGTQSQTFFEMHKLTEGQVTKWGDMRSLFFRYLVNGKQPEEKHTMGLLPQQGVPFAVQDDERALVLCNPKGEQYEEVSSLKLSLLLQEQTSPIEAIWFGDNKLDKGEGEMVESDWVIIEDGLVYLAFLPLCTTNLGRRAAVTSTQENGYRVISFFNYQGEAKNFAPADLKRVQNGFVFEAAPRSAYPTAAEFLKVLRKAERFDTTLLESRIVRYFRDQRELLLWLDPLQQSVKTAAVNGKVVKSEPLEADGIDDKNIPWLGQPMAHGDLGWWQRIMSRSALEGLEGVGGKLVES
jgi:hypothetical protein